MSGKTSAGMLGLRTRSNGHLIEAVLCDNLDMETDLAADEGLVIGSISRKIHEVDESVLSAWFTMMETAVVALLSAYPGMMSVATGATPEVAKANAYKKRAKESLEDPLTEFDKHFS